MADETPIIPGADPVGGAPAGLDRAVEPEPGTVPGQPAEEAGASGGFFSTRNGRLVLIAGAVAGLLVVAGIALALVIAVMGIVGGKADAPPAKTTAVVVTKPDASASTESSDTSITIAPIGNADVYTVRDPFQPLIQNPLAPSTPSSSTTSSTSTTSSSESTATQTGDENTLTLVSISTVDGVRKGTFLVGGTTYVAGAGEQLGDTPWQVVSIGSDSATVLYGDEQVTLAVGQGITK